MYQNLGNPVAEGGSETKFNIAGGCKSVDTGQTKRY
jgi:hypothetical protein